MRDHDDIFRRRPVDGWMVERLLGIAQVVVSFPGMIGEFRICCLKNALVTLAPRGLPAQTASGELSGMQPRLSRGSRAQSLVRQHPRAVAGDGRISSPNSGPLATRRPLRGAKAAGFAGSGASHCSASVEMRFKRVFAVAGIVAATSGPSP